MRDPTYIIVIDRATDIELNAAHEIIKSRANGWWHRFTNTWLVGGLSVSEWRDALRDTTESGPSSILVMKLPEAGGRAWSYIGPRAKERCEWLHENYKN